jgi:hypothetical protein
MISTNSDFVDFILPLRERLNLYDNSSPSGRQPKNDATDPAKAIPQGFGKFWDRYTEGRETSANNLAVCFTPHLRKNTDRSSSFTASASCS